MELRVGPDMTEVKSYLYPHNYYINSDWAHMGANLPKESLILMKNHKIINKNIKVVKLEILKVKTWFCDKDLSSLDSIN